jgi:hypothetical protein
MTFKGKKYIDRDFKFIIKLKKKYDTEDQLFDDLFLLYLNWYNSKTVSHNKFVEFNNIRSYYELNVNSRMSKSKQRYFLSKNLLTEYVKGNLTCPKRFLKIVTFLRGVKNKKPIRNNTVVETFVHNSFKVSSKEETGIIIPAENNYRLRLNIKFINFIRGIIRDLRVRGFLDTSDMPFFLVGNPGQTLTKDKCAEFLQVSKIKGVSTFPRIKVNSFLKKNVRMIMNYCADKFLDNDSEYKILLDRMKLDILDVFSRGDFKKELFDYFENRRLTIMEKNKKEIEQNIPDILKHVELLNAFRKGVVSHYLSNDDKKSLKEARDNKFWFIERLNKLGFSKRDSLKFLKIVQQRYILSSSSTSQDFLLNNIVKSIIDCQIEVSQISNVKKKRGVLFTKLKNIKANLAIKLEIYKNHKGFFSEDPTAFNGLDPIFKEFCLTKYSN